MLYQQDFNPRLATTFSFIPDKSFVGIGSTGAKQTSKGLFIFRLTRDTDRSLWYPTQRSFNQSAGPG